MTDGPRLSRRALLTALGLTGIATAGIAASAATGTLPAGVAMRHLLGAAGQSPVPKRSVVRLERVHSAARGRGVDLLTVLPPNVHTDGLPMSLMLHGLHGSARYAIPGNLPEALARVVAGGVPPFGFVAVDGGDNYWHENVPGDDPMAMLLDELPRWLAARGLGQPFACTGVSMGGFGALLYDRRRAERGQPVGAIAALSPGLLTSWPEMSKRHAFANEAQWAELDPLRSVDKLGPTPIGVWVGDHDTFIDGTRRFIRDARPSVASITPGGHNDAFFRSVVPDVLRFLGGHVPKPGRPG
ncbi:alpha/beta hydrolase [Solihabitans fulvus]|uniref:Acyl-CoA:diacylglycerol acyltransferase n=1 Tax=Solihabitans fulvus TaxID=1892852 RepID=A0A5B2XSS3_9PSEU|nr:alpha/beta hydrolase-fold protein [Solihabitans fulvus]KAA2266165.1 alpha/beta hydrolase [Solihabitans fulvus]